MCIRDRVKESGPSNPLALGRVTLVGRCAATEDPAIKAAFLAKNPAARFYADFADFSVWRLSVERVRYIGGFGRMSWPEITDWRAAEPDPIAPAAQGIRDHMNDDHVDAMRLYCQAYSRSGPVSGATMTGVDRYGFEMSAETADGPRPIRVAFSQPVSSAGEVRREMVALVKAAREKLGVTPPGSH